MRTIAKMKMHLNLRHTMNFIVLQGFVNQKNDVSGRLCSGEREKCLHDFMKYQLIQESIPSLVFFEHSMYFRRFCTWVLPVWDSCLAHLCLSPLASPPSPSPALFQVSSLLFPVKIKSWVLQSNHWQNWRRNKQYCRLFWGASIQQARVFRPAHWHMATSLVQTSGKKESWAKAFWSCCSSQVTSWVCTFLKSLQAVSDWGDPVQLSLKPIKGYEAMILRYYHPYYYYHFIYYSICYFIKLGKQQGHNTKIIIQGEFVIVPYLNG